MLKKLAVIAALAACGFARAEMQELKVVYKGFYDVYAAKFNQNLQQTAYFDVDDFNHDGTYTIDEVVEFRWSSVYYTPGRECWDGGVIWSCLGSFSYTPGSNPSFSASFQVSDDMFPWGESIAAGNAYRFYSQGYDEYWQWTDATKTWVLPADASVPSVPEPAQYGMLGLGLIGLLAASRRRR